MDRTSQGIIKTGRGEEQPADKDRAQLAHQTTSPDAPSREATGRPDDKDRKASGPR